MKNTFISNTLKKLKEKDITFWILFLAAMILSLWKIKYGFGERDEAFYLLLPHRIYQGDSLFFDERNRCLLFTFLTYPILKAYMSIFKSVEGIIINFRYIYLFFQAVSSFVIYYRLKSITKTGAMISSVVFLLYTPFNIMALSYNTIGIMTLTISLVLILTCKNRIDMYIAGLLYAASVICCPYLAINYFVYSAIVVYLTIKKKKVKYDALAFDKWLSITIGIAFLAILFLVFVFSRITIDQFLDSINFVTHDEIFHPERSVWTIITEYIQGTVLLTYYSKHLFILFFAILLIYLVDRNRSNHKTYYFAASVFVDILYLVHLFLVDAYPNFLMFPISVLGLLAFIFIRNETNKKMFLLYYITAASYTLFLSMTSNTKHYAIMSASSVALVISVIIIVEYSSSLKWNSFINKISKIFVVILMLLQVVFISHVKYWDVFSRETIKTQTRYIDNGPYKGVITNELLYDAYCNANEETDLIRKHYKYDSIVVFSQNIWIYLLLDDYRIASPSPWYTANPDRYTIVKLNEYYQSNPKKKPDLIYIDHGFSEVIKELNIIEEYEKKDLINGKIIYVIKR